MVSAKVYNSVIKIHSPLGLRAAISQHAAGFSTNGSHLLRDKIHEFFFFFSEKEGQSRIKRVVRGVEVFSGIQGRRLF